MATIGAANIQLFHELKIKYPEVPDEVVSNRMKENGNNKEKCIQALQIDSSKYLFGKPTSPRKLNTDLLRHIQELNISKSPLTSVVTKNKDIFTNIQSSIVTWPPVSNDVSETATSTFTSPMLIRQMPNINCHTSVDNSGTSSPQSMGNMSEDHLAVKVGKNSQSAFEYKIQIAEAGSVCPVSPAQTHSSQTTLFINRNYSNTIKASPDQINQCSSYNSYQHLNVHQSFIASGYPGAQQSSPHGFNRPLFVELRSSGPEGAQTQLHYFPTTPERSATPSTYSPLPSSDRYEGSNPPLARYHPYHIPQPAHHSTQAISSRSNITSQNETQILCLENGKGNTVMQASSEGRPFYSPGAISPASSHSSLSSESSNRDGTNQRTRSGSMQDETAYIQALLEHQRSRMEKLEHDYENELRTVEKLRNEVSQMEANMGERSARRNSFPTLEDLNRVRQSNWKVQTDIQMMLNELDMYKNGQTPFFMNMPTGQTNSIYSKQSSLGASRYGDSPPPVPPRCVHIPQVPTAQLSIGSGDSEDGEQWSCSACTLLNHPALNKCECCEMPRVIKGVAADNWSEEININGLLTKLRQKKKISLQSSPSIGICS